MADCTAGSSPGELAHASSVELSKQISELKEYVANRFENLNVTLDRFLCVQTPNISPRSDHSERPRATLQAKRTPARSPHDLGMEEVILQPSAPVSRPRKERRTRISILEETHRAVSRMAEDKHKQMSEMISLATGSTLSFSMRHCRRWLGKLFADRKFDAIMLGIVMLNLIVMSIELEIESHMPPSARPHGLAIANDMFTVLFLIELLSKWLAWGLCQYFIRSDWAWNLLDFIIVVLSLLEFGFKVAVGFNSQVSMSNSQAKVFRSLRVARVGRGLRVMRAVRFLIPLRMLLLSIANAMKALVWAGLLISAVLFGCGFIVREVVLDRCRAEAEELEGHRDVIPRCNDADVRLYWGSLGNTMLTLGMSVFGGVNWHAPLQALMEDSWLLLVIFLSFIAFMYLAMLNVVTGIFCQQAIESAQKDKEIALARQATRAKGLVESIQHCFHQIDKDGSGEITYDEFNEAHDDLSMRAFFQSIDMSFEAFESWTLFSFLDADKDGSITMDEFITGCLNFGGTARALQSAQIMLQQNKAQEMLKALQVQFCDMQEVFRALGYVPARTRAPAHVTFAEQPSERTQSSEEFDTSVSLGQSDAEHEQGRLSL